MLAGRFVYYAAASFEEKSYTKISRGICETIFKKRSVNHKNPFNVATYNNKSSICWSGLAHSTENMIKGLKKEKNCPPETKKYLFTIKI